MTPDRWLKRLGSLPLSYPPGERFHYSHATEVLGYLVARIEGKPLGQVLKDRIFTPLGMSDTSFWCPPEKRGRMARREALSGPIPAATSLQDVSFPHFDSQPALEPGGGGLISTADDYLKFARMMLGKGEVDGVRLVKASTIEMMTANRLTEAQRQIPFMGIPFWLEPGLWPRRLGDHRPGKAGLDGHGLKGARSAGRVAFGTWWQADPSEDMVMIYLIQNSMPLGPEAAAELATGQRMGGRVALPVFQKSVYAALGK